MSNKRLKERGGVNVTDDDISILSDTINNNTILERNESLEISLALNDSQINQSYMKWNRVVFIRVYVLTKLYVYG